MTDPRDLLHKIDYEGDEGVTWFRPDEFEDAYIQEQLGRAIEAYNTLDTSIKNLQDYIGSLSNDDDSNYEGV